MLPFEDSRDLPTLIQRLVDRIDPQRILPQLRSVQYRGRIAGEFVRLYRKGLFDHDPRYEVSATEDRVVFHDVPRRGERVVVRGSTVLHFRGDGSVKVHEHVGRALLRHGEGPLALGMTAEHYAAPLAREATRFLVGFQAGSGVGRPLAPTVATLCYFFARLERFYLWQIHLLEDPETQVQRLDEDDPVLETLNERFKALDPSQRISLRVRYPQGTSAHSRNMILVFDRRSGLMVYFRYRVTLLHPDLRAWHRVDRWCADPALPMLKVGWRRAVVVWDGSFPDMGEAVPYAIRFEGGGPFEAATWLPEGQRGRSAAASARG